MICHDLDGEEVELTDRLGVLPLFRRRDMLLAQPVSGPRASQALRAAVLQPPASRVES